MTRENKSTEEVLTDPDRIADLARQLREQGEIDVAEIVDVATEVRILTEEGKITDIMIPPHAGPRSGPAFFKVRGASRNKWVITDPKMITDLAQSADRIELAKELEVAARVEIWIDEDGGLNVTTDNRTPATRP